MVCQMSSQSEIIVKAVFVVSASGHPLKWSSLPVVVAQPRFGHCYDRMTDHSGEALTSDPFDSSDVNNHLIQIQNRFNKLIENTFRILLKQIMSNK